MVINEDQSLIHLMRVLMISHCKYDFHNIHILSLLSLLFLQISMSVYWALMTVTSIPRVITQLVASVAPVNPATLLEMDIMKLA